MKGEKGMPGVSVGDSLGEELTDDSFSKWNHSLQSVHWNLVSICSLLFQYSLIKIALTPSLANPLPAGIITADGQQQNVMVYTTSYQQVKHIQAPYSVHE